MKRGSASNRFLDRHLGIPFLFATSAVAKRRTFPKTVTRIGILPAPTLGDTLLTSGPVQDVRRHYPSALIICFSSPTNAAAVELLPGVDEIVSIRFTSPLSTIRTMRRCRLDLLIDFTPWQRITAFLSAASGAKFRLGFQTRNQHRHWHYDLTASHSSNVHEIDNYRTLLRTLGLNPIASPRLQSFDDSLNSASKRAKRLRRLIVFHPWATGDLHALREWPNVKWIELAKKICGFDAELLITGAPSQQSRSQRLCDQLASHGVVARPFVSPSGLKPLCALLHGADLVVTVNTGVMHLAAILGAPTVALNGPNSSHRWGPLGPRATAVDPSGGGGGYLHLGFEFAGNPTDCMERTKVDDVVAAIQRVAPSIFLQHSAAVSS